MAAASITRKSALKEALTLLNKDGIDTPQLDAEILLAHQLGLPRDWLLANLDLSLTPQDAREYRELVLRRSQYEPVAYLTGHKEFFGLDFQVTPQVLIPRPETEILVEVALVVDRQRELVSVVDVGVGSGAVAVALAVHLPWARLYGTDSSAAALHVAKENCLRHGVADRVILLPGDLLSPIPEPVELIVANLPYLSAQEMAALPPDVANHEPRGAIDGGPDGLQHLRRLLEQAPNYLEPHGALVLEMGEDQAAALADLARQHFPSARVAAVKDMRGHRRVLLVLQG